MNQEFDSCELLHMSEQGFMLIDNCYIYTGGEQQ